MKLLNLDKTRVDWMPYPRLLLEQEPSLSGRLLYSEHVYSPELRNYRPVIVYLPPSYAEDDYRYPVFYMQDGQNLFDPATSFAGESWGVGQTMNALAREAIEAIIVGVFHTDKTRIREYNPFPKWKRGAGERYLAFLVETLKPAIDRQFRTATGSPPYCHCRLVNGWVDQFVWLCSASGYFRDGRCDEPISVGCRLCHLRRCTRAVPAGRTSLPGQWRP